MSSPTSRTLAYLRACGCPLVQVVERWNQYAGIRQDLFGVIDVLAISAKGETIGVQCTSGDNVAARLNKLLASDALPVLRKAGWIVLVHGWRKSARSNRWVLREIDVSKYRRRARGAAERGASSCATASPTTLLDGNARNA